MAITFCYVSLQHACNLSLSYIPQAAPAAHFHSLIEAYEIWLAAFKKSQKHREFSSIQQENQTPVILVITAIDFYDSNTASSLGKVDSTQLCLRGCTFNWAAGGFS